METTPDGFWATPDEDPGTEPALRATVRDPVCGLDVEPERAAASTDYLGERYSFCSMRCKREFDAAPERYVGTANPTIGPTA